MSVFVIVGKNEPLYEVDLKPQPEDQAHLNQFVLHSALDMVRVFALPPLALTALR